MRRLRTCFWSILVLVVASAAAKVPVYDVNSFVAAGQARAGTGSGNLPSPLDLANCGGAPPERVRCQAIGGGARFDISAGDSEEVVSFMGS